MDPGPVSSAAHAAADGCIDCLRKLYAANGRFNNSAVACAAAYGGDLPCLEFVVNHGLWDDSWGRLAEYAMNGGHVHCLSMLRDIGCHLRPQLTTFAAECGDLDRLRFLHEHGCGWDGMCTASFAAEGGHLDCLQWAREHGCPWDGTTIWRAACNGRLDCLAYALHGGCPQPWWFMNNAFYREKIPAALRRRMLIVRCQRRFRRRQRHRRIAAILLCLPRALPRDTTRLIIDIL